MATAASTETDREQPKYCQAAHKGDGQTLATHFCKDCVEALCDMCRNYHNRIKSYSKHRLIPIENATAEDFILSTLDIDTSCQRHEGEEIKMVCRNDDELLCLMCAMMSHKECTEVVPIEDVILSFTRGGKLTIQLPKRDDIMLQLQKILDKKKTQIKELNQSEETVLSEASSIVKDINDSIHSLHNEFVVNTKEKYQQAKQALENTVGLISNSLGKLDTNTESMRFLDNIPPREAFILMKQLSKTILTECSTITQTLEQDFITKFNLNVNSVVAGLVNLSSLGDLQETKDDSGCSSELDAIRGICGKYKSALMIGTTVQFPVQQRINPLKRDFTLRKIIGKQDLKVGVVSPFDAVFLQDGSLLVSDSCSDNNRLIHLDKDFKFTEEIKLPGSPNVICLDDKKEKLYVACRGNSVFCSPLNGEWKFTKAIEMNVKQGAFCIACTGNTMIIGHCQYNNSQILLYNMNRGTMMRPVTTSVPYSNMYIALSRASNKFYHTDGGAIVYRKMDGTEIFRYRSKDMANPSGICVDDNNNVYVVCAGSKNVHQISHDGNSGRVIVNNVSRSPQGIAFHPSRDLFVVTSNENDKKLQVYEFS